MFTPVSLKLCRLGLCSIYTNKARNLVFHLCFDNEKLKASEPH